SGGAGGTVITTMAGNGSWGYGGDNGLATSATLFLPTGVAIDSSGNGYIVDYINNRIRKVTASTGVITIIAGTSGYVVVYGSCLGGVTSVQVDGSGIQVSSEYMSDGQINAVFQSTSGASQGGHSITVTTINGTNPPCQVTGGVMNAACSVFVTQVSLQSFSFTGSIQYSRDCALNATPVTSPTWPAPPAVCPQIGFAGDHAVYKSGDTMQGIVNFALTPAPPQGVTGILVKGTTAGYGVFTPTASVTISGGATPFSTPVSDDIAFLMSTTQFISPLNIDWVVGQTG